MHKFLLLQSTHSDNKNYQVCTQNIKTNQPVKQNKFTGA